MFLTLETVIFTLEIFLLSRNPLKSGQCFLHSLYSKPANRLVQSRNPLKSGQCFLRKDKRVWKLLDIAVSQSPQIGSMFLTESFIKVKTCITKSQVAIPSNRVNVSYLLTGTRKRQRSFFGSQSPQIGSMFLTLDTLGVLTHIAVGSQSPQIGSMFLTCFSWMPRTRIIAKWVAIPSNRVNVSYGDPHLVWCGFRIESQSPQIGSMFLTLMWI